MTSQCYYNFDNVFREEVNESFYNCSSMHYTKFKGKICIKKLVCPL